LHGALLFIVNGIFAIILDLGIDSIVIHRCPLDEHTDLAEVVGAFRFASAFEHLAHGGHEERDQRGNDGDHDDQLNESERRPAQRE
jgi:hypothetical protein